MNCTTRRAELQTPVTRLFMCLFVSRIGGLGVGGAKPADAMPAHAPRALNRRTHRSPGGGRARATFSDRAHHSQHFDVDNKISLATAAGRVD